MGKPSPDTRVATLGPLLARVAAAVPLGYLLVSTIGSLVAAGLARLGMARSESVVLASMLAILGYVVWILYVFAARDLRRLLLVLVGALLAGAAGLALTAG